MTTPASDLAGPTDDSEQRTGQESGGDFWSAGGFPDRFGGGCQLAGGPEIFWRGPVWPIRSPVW